MKRAFYLIISLIAAALLIAIPTSSSNRFASTGLLTSVLNNDRLHFKIYETMNLIDGMLYDVLNHDKNRDFSIENASSFLVIRKGEGWIFTRNTLRVRQNQYHYHSSLPSQDYARLKSDAKLCLNQTLKNPNYYATDIVFKEGAEAKPFSEKLEEMILLVAVSEPTFRSSELQLKDALAAATGLLSENIRIAFPPSD